MKKPLTDTLIRTVAAPASGRVEISDERCSGLTFRVTANRVRSWSFRFRDPRSNRLTRATLGTYPDLSLAEAREKTIDMRRAVAKGTNPIEEKRREREQAMTRTFGALADRYLKEHARRFKKTAEADERALTVHILPKWRARPYHSIGRRDVIELCEGIVATGKPIQANVLCNPMQRARETCELAGLSDKAVIDPDLVEWNYGEYEGLTTKQIHEGAPGWLIFRDGCPGGETPEQVGARVDRVIARSCAVDGDVALFAHGHVLRVLVTRWIGLPAGGGQHFLLGTGTLCVLGYYREIPAVRIWNGPLLD